MPYHETAVALADGIARKGFTVITGGGPGIMDAANRGALLAGGRSVGLCIDLPEERVTNPCTTRSLKFHYFFVRKVMLVKYATAFVLFPGEILNQKNTAYPFDEFSISPLSTK